MHQLRTARRPHPRIRISFLLAVAAVSVGLLATGALGNALARGGGVQVVKRVHNKALGRWVLTNLKGRTLYSLSAEKKGTFICVDSTCLSVWLPLLVPSGATPVGPVPLGTVMRPGGGMQVTYRGRPLYTFKGDAKAGQANGEGIKDVGTWHAAVVPKH